MDMKNKTISTRQNNAGLLIRLHIEFNYKLLNSVLNNNLSVSKWNKDVSAECECCQTVEDCEHLLFSCKLVKHIWQEVGNFFNFGISWKIIVLGFHYENNVKTRRLNNILSFICFLIYKYKMSCRINQERMSKENLKYFVKNNLIVENCVLKKLEVLHVLMICTLL